MTLKDFVNKYYNMKVDYDGVFGAQCVDLFRQYCADVLKIPHTGGVEGAKDLFINYAAMPLEQKYFYRIPLTDETPEPGDVLIWGPSDTNKYGHVAICLSAFNKVVQVFEQDGYAQDGAKITTRTYNRMLGWLRPKEKE